MLKIVQGLLVAAGLLSGMAAQAAKIDLTVKSASAGFNGYFNFSYDDAKTYFNVALSSSQAVVLGNSPISDVRFDHIIGDTSVSIYGGPSSGITGPGDFFFIFDTASQTPTVISQSVYGANGQISPNDLNVTLGPDTKFEPAPNDPPTGTTVPEPGSLLLVALAGLGLLSTRRRRA